MSLFQNLVVTKQLQSQNKTKLDAGWNAFKNQFHNLTIQDNIRNSKEEQYQGEFLIDLFVNVLGYTKNPTPNFNLTTEYKNVKDSKKADGAILVPGPTGLNPLGNKSLEVNLPKKLQNWYLLSYADFIKELAKQKIKLTLSQEAEWEEYFTTEATKVKAINT
jgi:hypothetical protein